jgi:uncharacterized protein (TIGR01777 family)
VVVLSRRPARARWRTVSWDGHTIGAWLKEIDGADAVINLAGRSVDCRYTARNREEILNSRVHSTRATGIAIGLCSRPPRVWLQASTATIYPHQFDGDHDELAVIIDAMVPEWQFSIDVAKAWEATFDHAPTPMTRKVKMRMAPVMSPERQGMFDILLRLVRFGLGGPAGNGRQFVSWIHHLDFVRSVEWIVDDEDIFGPVNVAAPHPLPNEEFMQAIAGEWGAVVALPLPAALLRAGALLARTEPELILKSRRAVPRKLLTRGFQFRFPVWPGAAGDLCDEWRERHGRELRRSLLPDRARF